MEIFEKVQAINRLMPDAIYVVNDDSEIIWGDDRPMPTDSDLSDALKIINKERDDWLKTNSCQKWILNFYPLEKQNSDNTDKAFWEPILKAQGYDKLESTVVGYVKRFVDNNESFSKIMADEPDATRASVGQLVKTGIRLNWVIDCKYELAAAKAESRALNLPPFPVII